MKFTDRILLALISARLVAGNNSDVFNYGTSDKTENNARSFAKQNWDDVTCSDQGSCVSLDKHELLLLSHNFHVLTPSFLNSPIKIGGLS